MSGPTKQKIVTRAWKSRATLRYYSRFLLENFILNEKLTEYFCVLGPTFDFQIVFFLNSNYLNHFPIKNYAIVFII
jgi:hypothetical protein